MAKEAKEFNAVMGAGVNTGYIVLEDGKILIDDLSKALPFILEAEKGFNGLSEYGPEMAKATIPEKEELLETLVSRMPNVPEDDRYDLSRGIHGVQMIFSMAFRKGVKEGEARALRAMEGK